MSRRQNFVGWLGWHPRVTVSVMPLYLDAGATALEADAAGLVGGAGAHVLPGGHGCVGGMAAGV